MFLHIGNNEVISAKDIIGIFSIKQFLKSKENLINYKNLVAKNRIAKNSEKNSKSLILLKNGDYVESCISASTLSKRMDIERILKNLPKWGVI